MPTQSSPPRTRRSLDVSRNEALASLSPLAGLTQLTALHCSWLTLLADLEGLPPGLASLHCAHCAALHELAPLSACTQLTALHCFMSGVRDLAPLGACAASLVHLDCTGTQVGMARFE